MSVTIVTNLYPDSDAPFFGTFVRDTVDFFGSPDDVVYPGNKVRKNKWRFYARIYSDSLRRFSRSDTVVFHFPLYFTPLVLIASILRKTVVLIYHGGEFMERPNQGVLLRCFKMAVFHINNYASHRILTPSHTTQERYFRRWRAKTKVWYSGGVKMGESRDLGAQRSYKFGFFGRHDPVKGHDVFINAVTSLSPGPELTCLSVCRENSTTTEQVLENGVRLVNHVPIPHAMVDSYLRECEFVVIPSRNESLCLVAIEASCAGAVVVARELPAIVETLGDAGLYFSTDANLATLLEQALMISPGEMTSLRRRQRERVARFDRELVRADVVG